MIRALDHLQCINSVIKENVYSVRIGIKNLLGNGFGHVHTEFDRKL